VAKDDNQELKELLIAVRRGLKTIISAIDKFLGIAPQP
jgi:hypothetical protein